MKPQIYIVTLAVEDLDRAIHFYQEGIGLGTHMHGGDHALFQLQDFLTLALTLRADHDKVAGQVNGNGQISSTSITYRADSQEEVDDILAKAEAAGGTIPSEPIMHDWGYHGHFKDPDGHLWEVAYFNSPIY
ncbi:VOC family protein [Aerococcaceae bacterium 50-4]